MSPKNSASNHRQTSLSRTRGPVMAIGGAEAKDKEQKILTCFLELAGGKQSNILVIPTASEDPSGTGKNYRDVFLDMGAHEVSILEIEFRADANAERVVEQIEQASGVYITGGDQARLITFLVGTRAMEALRKRNAAGVIVAGTSAGASILADHLLVGGGELPFNSNDATARRSLIELSAGFGLLRDSVIDQHFSARGRIGRLLSAFAATPGLLGLGIDEATAALIRKGGTLEVIGIGSVTILDGRNVISDFSERGSGELLSLADISLHVLAPGRQFKVDTHMPVSFEETKYQGPTSTDVLAQSLEAEMSAQA
jgi:cyanophycinase